MFLLVFIAIVLSNYVAVADLEEKYKYGYFVVLIIISLIVALLKIL